MHLANIKAVSIYQLTDYLHNAKKITLNIYLVFILSYLLLNIGCKGEDSTKIDGDKSEPIVTNDKTFKYKNKLFSIPSPFHIISLLKDTKTQYNIDLLNPTSNIVNYSLSEKKALNLGVYIADLGYTNIYEQHSSAIQYIKATKELSSDLQLMNSNSINLITEIEENFENPDSLNKIFANTYREIDLYLKDNDRNFSSTLIIGGAWIEGLYLMTQTAKSKKNKKIINRIGEQKYSIKNLLILLSQGKTEEKKFHKDILTLFTELKELFDLVEINYKYDKQIVSPNEKKTIIISETNIKIPNEILEKITLKTESIRNFIIK